MNPGEKARLFHELGQLVRAGAPFPKAVEKLARHCSGRARSSLLAVKRALDGGLTVSESLRAGAPLVGSLEACVFAASDRAGRLEAGLDQASQYHGAIAAARSQMKSRLAYPVFIIHFAMLVLPVPALFAEGGGLTPYLKAAGFAIGGLWLGVFILAALIRTLLSLAERSAATDRFLRKLPPFGTLRRDFSLARFCSAYHMQLGSGVNVLASIETSGAASGSALLRDATLAAMPAIRSGGQVSEALHKTGVFPMDFLRAFAVGEETGRLDHELERIANEHRSAGLRRLDLLAEWIPRLIYIGIVLYIGWSILASYTGRMRAIQDFMRE